MAQEEVLSLYVFLRVLVVFTLNQRNIGQAVRNAPATLAEWRSPRAPHSLYNFYYFYFQWRQISKISIYMICIATE